MIITVTDVNESPEGNRATAWLTTTQRKHAVVLMTGDGPTAWMATANDPEEGEI